ncbi:glycine cleavage system protein R [Luteococcus peritonei]|uniref:Glycine cleavage system protein R n=1 Tax=Luteococcus peritonei TaxID=88874 RepID=A0ABW4RTG6_9ACTN
MAKLVLTLIGDDREGLVSALSSVVADHDGNWLESQLARLAGKFAGVALVEVPDSRANAFRAAARTVEGLDVVVTPADGEVAGEGTPVTLNLVGNDRVGIVREVTSTLARQGITIDELHTSTRPAPMAEGKLFEAVAQLRVPGDVELTTVREQLEAIASELMVDIDVDETPDDL